MLSKITVTVAIVTLMIENENSYVLHPTFLAYFFSVIRDVVSVDS